MTKRPVTIGIIGLGAGADPHLKSLADLAAHMPVLLAATPSAARASARQSTLPFPVTTDIDAVIRHPDIEVVIIITPPNTHLDITLACLEAGKHVLVEKPIELTSAGGQRMVDLASKRNLRLGLMLQHRMRPGVRRLKAALEAGELGTLVSASAIINWWRPQSYYNEPGRGTLARDGGGVLLTQAIHALDVFRSLVDVPTVEAAQVCTTPVHAMETEDHVHALVRIGNGAPGVIVATTAAYPGGPERIEILGTRACASLIGGSLAIERHDGTSERIEAEGLSGGGANMMDFAHDAHRDVIADFGDAVRTGRDPAIPGRDGVATQRLIEAMLEAASTRRG